MNFEGCSSTRLLSGILNQQQLRECHENKRIGLHWLTFFMICEQNGIECNICCICCFNIIMDMPIQIVTTRGRRGLGLRHFALCICEDVPESAGEVIQEATLCFQCIGCHEHIEEILIRYVNHFSFLSRNWIN